MNRLILITLLISLDFLLIKSQNIDSIRNSKSIEAYQNYLIENPETPHIIELTDSLRLMWDKINIENYHCSCFGNCLEIYVNSECKILFEQKPIELNELENLIYHGLINPDNEQNLPEKEYIKSEYFGVISRSKGVVNVVTKNIKPEFYSEIIKIIKKAFDRVRSDYSWYFQKEYEELTYDQKKEIEKVIPYKINMEIYMPWKLRLPVPVPKEFQLDGLPDADLE